MVGGGRSLAVAMCYCPYSLPRKSIIYIIKTEASVPITHRMPQTTHTNNNNTPTHTNNNSPHNTARRCDTDLVQVLIECITELVLILIYQFQQCSQLSQSPLQGTCSPRAKHNAHVTDHLVQKGSVSVATACVHKQQIPYLGDEKSQEVGARCHCTRPRS